MADERRRFVKVACQHPGGIRLRLLDPEPGKEQATGKITSVVVGGPSALHAGVGAPTGGGEMITEVDAEFWGAWLEQNRGKNPMLDMGVIHEVKDDDE